jgi:hypothetical protein
MTLRRRNRIAGQFSARTIEMMESPAFEVLSLAGHRILARLEIEMAHHGGADNGKLPVTFDQFAEYGIHRHAISPALREVCALGFVEITEQGRAGNAEWRRPNLFRLTYRPVGNAKPTEEWRRITASKDAKIIALKARASAVRKNRIPVPVSANSQCGNRHRKCKINSTETITTGHSTETVTTSIFSGRKPEGPPPLHTPQSDHDREVDYAA